MDRTRWECTYTTNKINIPIRWWSIQFKPYEGIKRIEAVNHQKKVRKKERKKQKGKNKLYMAPHEHNFLPVANTYPGKVNWTEL